jgi:hypothetical protein
MLLEGSLFIGLIRYFLKARVPLTIEHSNEVRRNLELFLIKHILSTILRAGRKWEIIALMKLVWVCMQHTKLILLALRVLDALQHSEVLVK